MRNNNTRSDYFIHWACDLLMFATACLAYWKPILWDFVGIVWFLLYCTYHISTAYLESYSFSQVRLLAGDLQAYQVMLMLLLNSNSWVADLIIVNSMFFVTCWLMAENSLQHAIDICITNLGISQDSVYYPECI